MPETKTARWHIIFHGKVQHVGFRYTSLYFCRKLKLTGWVRNLEDGTVEMEVQGSISSLRRLIMMLKGVIHITDMEISDIPLLNRDFRFSVL